MTRILALNRNEKHELHERKKTHEKGLEWMAILRYTHDAHDITIWHELSLSVDIRKLCFASIWKRCLLQYTTHSWMILTANDDVIGEKKIFEGSVFVCLFAKWNGLDDGDDDEKSEWIQWFRDLMDLKGEKIVCKRHLFRSCKKMPIRVFRSTKKVICWMFDTKTYNQFESHLISATRRKSKS